jgi:peroxiredoxin
MKRILVPVSLLAVAAVGAGLQPAKPASFKPPSYRSTVGTKLFYTTTSETPSSRSGQRWQVWTVGVNPDSSFRLLVRLTQVRYGADSTGKATEEEWRTDWSRCALYAGGRIPANASIEQADVRSLFVPLPADSQVAASGWQRRDTAMAETEEFRLDNKTLSDSVWLVDFTRKTPLDDVYLLSSTGRYRFDTRRGLVLGKTSETRQDWGSRAGTTKRTTTLDSVVKVDAGAMARLGREMDVWFEADSAYSTLLDRASEEPKRRGALVDSARTAMDSGRARVTDTAIQAMFGDEVGTLEEITRQMDGESRWRDSAIGSPAPNWTLPDLAGKKHSLKEYRGKVVILDFWYRGCPWCIRAMPQLNTLARQYSDKHVVVLGMNIDKELADAQFVVDKLGLSYVSLRCGDTYKKYGVSGFPTLFVIDGKGRVSDIHVGYSPDLEQKLERSIRRAIGED